MQTLRFAVATNSFGQTLRKSLETAADIGAQGVQLDARTELQPVGLSETGRRQFLHQLDEMGLSVASLSFPARRSYYNPEHLDARVAATKAAMQLAYQLRARVVTARIGRIPSDKESADYQVLRDVLNDLARHGNHIGATLAITPTNDSPTALAELIAATTDGPIGIDFDPANFVMTGSNPVEAWRDLYQSVAHVQIRDGVSDIDGSGLEVPVGRGEVEWDEFLALTNEADYRSWLTVKRTTGDDKVNDCARAIQYLRRVAMGG